MAGPRRSPAFAFVAYSALRLLLFGVPLLVIYALGRNALVAAVLAAVIGFALSMILLDRQRGTVAQFLQQRAQTRRVVSDETLEDEAVEHSGSAAAGTPAARAGDQNESAAASPRP